ncbi:MAG TPA: hypothetical protein VFE22_11795, partial [Edaphobacter sp.]|nr:hypothetical protein [Edaphobacter sp.]
MASTSTSIDAATQPASAVETGRLLVSLPPLANGELSIILRNLAAAFPERTVLVATPSSLDGAQDPVPDTLRILSYRP